jgi:hypothetical protein
MAVAVPSREEGECFRYLTAMTLWFGTAQDAQVPNLGASGLTGVRNVRNEIGFVFDVDPADVNPLVEDALDQLEITG